MSSGPAMSAGYVSLSGGRHWLLRLPASGMLFASSYPRLRLRSAQPSAALGLSIIKQVTRRDLKRCGTRVSTQICQL